MSTPSATQLASLTLLGPLATAFILAVVPRLRAKGWPAVGLSLSAAALSAVAAICLLALTDQARPIVVEVSWLPHAQSSLVEVGLRIDGLSATMLTVVTLVALAVQVFSIGYMHDELPAAKGRYFSYHSFFIFSMNLLVLAPNLLQFFLGWELVGLTSYLLIGFYYRKPSAAHAAIKAFWVTKFADMGLVLALVALFVIQSSFAYDTELGRAEATLVTLLLFLAVMGKSAQFPLHIWLPNAMEGPTPVSALLHAATMVAAGVYLLVRASPLFLQAPLTLDLMVWVGAVTALFAAFVAVFQTDIKRVLAYSTCSQLGYMVAAVGAKAPIAAQLHLTTHACFKALLFLAAGSVIHAVHSNELASMGGLGRRMPFTTATFGIGALALAGFPGLSGFFSKDWILESLSRSEHYVPLVLLLAAAFLTAFYMGRVTLLAFVGTSAPSAEGAHESPLSMLLPLGALAAAALGVGWFASALVTRLGGHYAFHLGAFGIAGTGLALTGLLIAWLAYGQRRIELERTGWFRRCNALARSRAVDGFYERLYAFVLLELSAFIAWFDRYVIDGAMNWAAWASVGLGRRLQRLQSGNVLDYVAAVVAGALVMVAWRLFS